MPEFTHRRLIETPTSSHLKQTVWQSSLCLLRFGLWQERLPSTFSWISGLITKLINDEAGGSSLSSPNTPESSLNNSAITLFLTDSDRFSASEWYSLYEREPLFRRSVDRCAAIVQPYLDQPILSVMFPYANSPHERFGSENPDEADAIHRFWGTDSMVSYDEIAYRHVIQFILLYAWVSLYKAKGLEAVLLIGHGAGEYAAACHAEVFSLEDGLKMLAVRGQLLPLLLERDREATDEFAKLVASISLRKPTVPMISTLTRESVSNQVTFPNYWVHHAREIVSPLSDKWLQQKKVGYLMQASPSLNFEALGSASHL